MRRGCLRHRTLWLQPPGNNRTRTTANRRRPESRRAPHRAKHQFNKSALSPCIQVPNLRLARSCALAASSSRLFGGAFVSSEQSRRADAPAISSTAPKNEASFAFEGFWNPLIFLTNWSAAARTSSSVIGGSKLKSGLIFLHIRFLSYVFPRQLLLPTNQAARIFHQNDVILLDHRHQHIL